LQKIVVSKAFLISPDLLKKNMVSLPLKLENPK